MAKLLTLILFLFSISANAGVVSFRPQKILGIARTATGAVVSTEYAGVSAANDVLFATRAVNVGKTAIGAALRARLFTPWGLALTAAITAAGYYLNNNGSDVSRDAATYDGLGSCKLAVFYSGAPPKLSIGDCLARVNSDWSVGYAPEEVPFSVGALTKHHYVGFGEYKDCLAMSGSGTVIEQYAFCYDTPPPADANFTPTQNMTDAQLGDWAQNNLTDSQYRDVLTSDLSAAPNPEIPAFSDVGDDISSDWDAQNDGDSTTSPTVNIPNGDTGTDTVSDQEPEKKPDDDENKDPCKSNPNLLSCLDAGEVQPPVDIATKEVSFSFSPFSLASNASCPVDITLPRGLSLSWSPVCTFAEDLKPVIVAVAFLSALLIVSGGRKE